LGGNPFASKPLSSTTTSSAPVMGSIGCLWGRFPRIGPSRPRAKSQSQMAGDARWRLNHHLVFKLSCRSESVRLPPAVMLREGSPARRHIATQLRFDPAAGPPTTHTGFPTPRFGVSWPWGAPCPSEAPPLILGAYTEEQARDGGPLNPPPSPFSFFALRRSLRARREPKPQRTSASLRWPACAT
jgi:hypothetical protein